MKAAVVIRPPAEPEDGINEQGSIALPGLHWNTTSCRRTQTCRGQKYQRIEGTPSLSAKPARKCHGTRKAAAADQGAKYIAAVMASVEAVEQV